MTRIGHAIIRSVRSFSKLVPGLRQAGDRETPDDWFAAILNGECARPVHAEILTRTL